MTVTTAKTHASPQAAPLTPLEAEAAAHLREKKARQQAQSSQANAQKWAWVCAKLDPKTRRWMERLACTPPRRISYDGQ